MDTLQNEYEERISSHSRRNLSKHFRKSKSSRKVRFLEDEVDDGPTLESILQDNNNDGACMKPAKANAKESNSSLMHGLGIYHDQPGSGPLDTNTGSARRKFCRTLYDDDGSEQSLDDEYDDDDDDAENSIARGLVYQLGGTALAIAIGGAMKAIRKSTDSDFEQHGLYASEMAETIDISEVAGN